jgi:hypothetical protein
LSVVCCPLLKKHRVKRDGDLNGEVGTRNVEFFSLLMANGQNRLNRERLGFEADFLW